jgi:hypothetical protein
MSIDQLEDRTILVESFQNQIQAIWCPLSNTDKKINERMALKMYLYHSLLTSDRMVLATASQIGFTLTCIQNG